MPNDILFPCKHCYGWEHAASCPVCKGSGKSERQLLLDIRGALMLVVDLLKEREPAPVPSPVPGRRDVVYGPSPRDQVIGPGLRKKQETPFPTLTEADKADLRARMDVARAERAKKGK